MGQHFAFSMPKSTPARKKYTTAGCVVVTNISYARDKVTYWRVGTEKKHLNIKPVKTIKADAETFLV